MRNIIIKDEELKALVEKKGELVMKGRKHYQNMEKLNDEGNVIGEERNTLVAQIIEKTAEAIKDEPMSEFELALTTEIVDGEVQVSVIDRVEQFKESLKEERERAERREAGEMTPEESMEDNKAKVIEAIAAIDPMEIDTKLQEILTILE